MKPIRTDLTDFSEKLLKIGKVIALTGIAIGSIATVIKNTCNNY